MIPITDIEQLSYLGMRLALRQSVPAPDLRAYSRNCAQRRNANLRYWIENEDLPPVLLEGLEKVQSAHDLRRGVVVTSFQVGPYNWLPLILNTQAHLPVTLLVDRANFSEEQRRWTSRETNYRGNLAEPIRYVNSEEPTAVWKMARSLRECRTLVGWFDGHSGVTEADSAKSILEVRFCETSMRVRMGLAYLSARFGAPLILAVLRNNGESGIAIRFEDALARSENETIEEFCHRASRHFVSILEDEVREDPACWEEWCHFHSWNIFDEHADPRADLSDEDFLNTVWRFDQDNVDLLSMSDGNVVVSLSSRGALAMTPLIAAIRDALIGERTALEVVTGLSTLFPRHDIHNALYILSNALFIVKATRSD